MGVETVGISQAFAAHAILAAGKIVATVRVQRAFNALSVRVAAADEVTDEVGDVAGARAVDILAVAVVEAHQARPSAVNIAFAFQAVAVIRAVRAFAVFALRSRQGAVASA